MVAPGGRAGLISELEDADACFLSTNEVAHRNPSGTSKSPHFESCSCDILQLQLTISAIQQNVQAVPRSMSSLVNSLFSEVTFTLLQGTSMS